MCAYHRLMQNRALIPVVLIAVCASIAPVSGGARAPDGSRDFDFNFGTWRTHIARLAHPLTGSTKWLSYAGTVTVRKVWGGAANVEEIEADGPGHLEIVNVRMFDPQSRQWSLNGADSADGTLGTPMYGEFQDGRGVFYDQEAYHGRMVLVRQIFYGISASAYSFQQAFSDDGGSTWQPNFTARLTRLSATAPSEGAQNVTDTSHDFDFNYGTWTTHITTPQGRMTGTVAVRKIWNGRAFLEEIEASGGSGGFQGLTLYLYDPQSRQWSQTYADRSDGTFEAPAIGAFKDGRGVLIGPDRHAGKAVLTRDEWSDITANAHHFQIAYSDDGGRHWHPTFTAGLTRVGPGL